jgi:hypothetical protein
MYRKNGLTRAKKHITDSFSLIRVLLVVHLIRVGYARLAA